jgi:hypothetical protein
METIRTIECYSCNYTTDVEITDVTAPRHCPDCRGDLFISGTEISWPTDDAASCSQRVETRDEEWTRTQPPCGLDDSAEGNDAWLDAHTCPICGTLAPDCYDDEEHPSWDCSPCLGVRP